MIEWLKSKFDKRLNGHAMDDQHREDALEAERKMETARRGHREALRAASAAVITTREALRAQQAVQRTREN